MTPRVGMFLVSGAMALGWSAAAQPAPDYLGVVRAYADAMLTHGRDTYGAEQTPLFAVALDRETTALLEGERLEAVRSIPREDWGIRDHDRILTGANPMHDQNLYQVLYALTEITGQPRYAAAADEALDWFFTHTQSPATGLLAWGEHMGWDFRTEAVVEKPSGDIHEYFRPWAVWERTFRVAPEAARRLARGVWDHQIHDQTTGAYSRHAFYSQHGTDSDDEYPRHGGFYIATWAQAYHHTGDPVFLEAIETVLGYLDGRRSPASDAIPAESNERSEGRLAWPGSNLSLAIDLTASAPLVTLALGRTMRLSAARTDAVFLRVTHELGPGGAGFVKSVDTHTLAPGDVRFPQASPYTRAWATGYGDATDANFANLCLARYRQTGDPAYFHLVRATADRYLDLDPDLSFPVYPGTFGDVILLLVGVFELTDDTVYLDRADALARQALALFFDAASPLPRATSAHDHYEAITRADTLMMALLDLWAAQWRHRFGVAVDPTLVYTDR